MCILEEICEVVVVITQVYQGNAFIVSVEETMQGNCSVNVRYSLPYTIFANNK